jgi:hypothetical protein
MQTMRDQAERFGTRFVTDVASRVQLATEPGGGTRSGSTTTCTARAP